LVQIENSPTEVKGNRILPIRETVNKKGEPFVNKNHVHEHNPPLTLIQRASRNIPGGPFQGKDYKDSNFFIDGAQDARNRSLLNDRARREKNSAFGSISARPILRAARRIVSGASSGESVSPFRVYPKYECTDHKEIVRNLPSTD